MVRSTNASPNHPRRFEEEEDTGLGWPPAVSRGCPGHLEEEEEEGEEEEEEEEENVSWRKITDVEIQL